MTLAIDQETVHSQKKKNGMLPVLIVLFLISYGLMSALVIEQGRTIDSQRGLINNLFSDSVELNAMKMKEILRQRAMQHSSGDGQKQNTGPQAPSQKLGKNGGVQRRAMQRPPKATADTMDSRRIPIAI